MAEAPRDQNFVPAVLFESSATPGLTISGKIDEITGRILVESSSGSGTVTTVSVVSTNGFAGTVANATTTPAITLTTTINSPALAGNGTAIAAATTTGTGSTVVLAGSPTITTASLGSSTATTQAQLDNSTKLSTTAYVDLAVSNAIAGVNPAVSVSAATTAAGNTSTWTYSNGASGVGATFTGPVNTAIVIDGITFSSLTQSLLVKNDTQSPSGAFNGVYNLTALQTVGTGAIFTRRSDYNSPSDINNTGVIPVIGGTVNATTSWLQTATIVTVGTTALVYVQFSYSPTSIIPPNLGGTGVANNSASTITIASAKTLTFNNTFTFAGTDSTTMTFPATSATIARTDAANTFTGASTASAWVLTSPTITTKISPTSDDGAPLGDTTHNFSDIFLASGAIVNFANSNVVITHTSGILTMGTGELRITTPGTNSASVPTLGSTSTLTNKTLTAPVIGGAASLADAATISLIIPTVDGTATGHVTSAFVSGYTSSAVGDLVILDSSGKWQKTDANTSSIYNGLLGIAMAVAATDAALLVALPGSMVYATAFPTMTIGAAMYMSETAGVITATAPTTTDAATRLIGYAIHADKIFFNPSNDWITHT